MSAALALVRARHLLASCCHRFQAAHLAIDQGLLPPPAAGRASVRWLSDEARAPRPQRPAPIPPSSRDDEDDDEYEPLPPAEPTSTLTAVRSDCGQALFRPS